MTAPRNVMEKAMTWKQGTAATIICWWPCIEDDKSCDDENTRTWDKKLLLL